MKSIFTIIFLIICIYCNALETKVEILKDKENIFQTKTLLGEDKNNNGIRDDVEDYIYKEYKNEPVIIKLLLQYAKGEQDQLKYIQEGNDGLNDSYKLYNILVTGYRAAIGCYSELRSNYTKIQNGSDIEKKKYSELQDKIIKYESKDGIWNFIFNGKMMHAHNNLFGKADKIIYNTKERKDAKEYIIKILNGKYSQSSSEDKRYSCNFEY